MKRIIAVSTLAVATLVGFSSVANAADTGISTHEGTVAKTCAVIATNGTLAPVANNIAAVGGNFPKVLSSATADTGTPGKFVTLCNTDPSQITISVGTVTVPAGQVGHTTAVALTSPSATVYPAAFLATTSAVAPAVIPNTSSTAVAHAFSALPTDLNVTVKITADTGKVLVGSAAAGSYSVPVTATLVP
jgi:hypothetical protein